MRACTNRSNSLPGSGAGGSCTTSDAGLTRIGKIFTHLSHGFNCNYAERGPGAGLIHIKVFPVGRA